LDEGAPVEVGLYQPVTELEIGAELVDEVRLWLV
jgi:hypothetical protein